MPTEVRLNATKDRYPADVSSRYWEIEEPAVALAGNVEIRWYREAQKLQFVQLILNRDGSARFGKIVTLGLDDLAANLDALNLLQCVLNDASDGAD